MFLIETATQNERRPVLNVSEPAKTGDLQSSPVELLSMECNWIPFEFASVQVLKNEVR